MDVIVGVGVNGGATLSHVAIKLIAPFPPAALLTTYLGPTIVFVVVLHSYIGLYVLPNQ